MTGAPRSSSPQAAWLEQLEQASNYSAWIYRAIRRHLCGHVLEVGCGTGTISVRIAAVADSLTAIDIDPVFVQRARQRLDQHVNVSVLQADATRDLPDMTFDTIVMLDVLEHMPDDAAMLCLLADRLAPGGSVVLKVPALPGLHNSLDRAVGHYRRYDGRTLRRSASQAGLEVSRIEAFNIAGIPGWWWNGLMRKTVAPASQVGGFDKLVPILERIERVVSPPVGLSYIAVLKRPTASRPNIRD